MDNVSLKIFLIGIGFIIGGLVVTIGLALHLFPVYKVRRARATSVIGFIAGLVLMIIAAMTS